MSSQRRPAASGAAVAALCLAAGVAWHAAPDALQAPAAESPRASPDEAWVTPAVPPLHDPTRALRADLPSPALRMGASARAAASSPTTPSALGTLVSHGSGVWVQSAPASGLGRELDLTEGDRIVRINGRAVTQAAEVASLLAQRPARGVMHIEGLRNGQPISLYHAGQEVGSPAE
ncbi:hypothetical protein [Rubrivivax rivuli]|uniref:PDZ domain-containing protein n=1 Tax=Rubrivivax rivuli TaxID=1862385 RepID=A0A437RI49_9BURK|nr:hypothetical protein [Rubrivivax rivuli]RVU46385.1 hypothetical protein EOE66_11160 [Rubrivivax rivuli]